MGRKECIHALEALRDKIRQFEKLEDDFNDAQAKLNEANNLLPFAVDDFDQKHKKL